ncbi:hypothetical protein [Enterobacillus tribolii]|uniref:hypothetical protein n=1 Tax=Enterobacillus tribolii TaxID=1487935 RepID=UPI000E1CA602|nr:hypothetical protein [Enterobacillus tribolii]MBW7982678.1 hypothetical protein [Enterobacillus tribolii]
MYMDDEFLESNDLDWFSSYKDGLLAHFATGGGCEMPEEVRRFIDNYEIIYDYFHSLGVSTDIEIIEENLPLFLTQEQRERYLQSFINIACKGICSYDIRRDDSCYKLIAKPKVCLRYDQLPEEVRKIIYILPKEIMSGSVVVKNLE